MSKCHVIFMTDPVIAVSEFFHVSIDVELFIKELTAPMIAPEIASTETMSR